MQSAFELSVNQALQAWNLQVTSTGKLLEILSNSQLEKETAPGKNRGTYLLGHLAAVHDRMLTLLGLQDRLYPELDEPYIIQPDNKMQLHSTEQLRQYWSEINETLDRHFKSLHAEEWMQRHTAVSEDDFKTEPHRNRLNVLLSRTSHLAYHLGQMNLLK